MTNTQDRLEERLTKDEEAALRAQHRPGGAHGGCIGLHRCKVQALLASYDAALRQSQDIEAAALDQARLREAFWEANKNHVWGEAIDTTDRMADQVLAEYAALAAKAEEAPR